MFLKNSLVPWAAGIAVSLVQGEVLPTMTSWLLCRVSSRLCFMRRVRKTWMGLSKIFSRERRKSERTPNLLPVVRFKINFHSILYSCFSFCYDTIWRPDFTELANKAKPILGKFLSCFLVCFPLLIGATADIEREKNVVSWSGWKVERITFFRPENVGT